VIEDVVGPRDVVVRLATSGICHTDVNVLDGLCPPPDAWRVAGKLLG
jgi:D-arabinose 1-dehydrogenase-like Zn-dependent alcohol dehydrogenase